MYMYRYILTCTCTGIIVYSSVSSQIINIKSASVVHDVWSIMLNRCVVKQHKLEN